MYKFKKTLPLVCDKVLQTKPRVEHGIVFHDVVAVDDPFPEHAKNMRVSDFSLSVLSTLGADPNSGVVMLQRGKLENAVNITDSTFDEDSFNRYVEDTKAFRKEMQSSKDDVKKDDVKPTND